MNERVGIIIIGHGSRRDEANRTLYLVAEELRRRLGTDEVEPAFFSLVQPDVPTAIKKMVDRGCGLILAQPYFLFKGNHTSQDIPLLLDDCMAANPGLRLQLLDTFGSDPRLIDVVEENVLKHLPGLASLISPGPDRIERTSMEYIESRLSYLSIPLEHLPVVKRVVHSTADFDFARTFILHPDAVRAGVEALSGGCNVIVDVSMVMAGITRCDDSKLICSVHDQEVKQFAKTKGITRSAAAMEKLKGEMNGAVVAVGNAPTALYKLIEMVQKGEATPALIVGVPVGFVEAAQSKAALAELDYPHITNAGPRGGSPVAAAIVNALAIESQGGEEK